jgi:hypothetical protein
MRCAHCSAAELAAGTTKCTSELRRRGLRRKELDVVGGLLEAASKLRRAGGPVLGLGLGSGQALCLLTTRTRATALCEWLKAALRECSDTTGSASAAAGIGDRGRASAALRSAHARARARPCTRPARLQDTAWRATHVTSRAALRGR